jgi:ATP-binding cassette subfamily B protein
MRKQINIKRTLKNLNNYNSKYKKLFWIATLGSIFGVLFQDILAPFAISRAFLKMQSAYARHQYVNFGYLVPYVIAFTVFMILGLIIWRIQGYSAWLIEDKVEKDMIIDAFDKLEHKGQTFHSNRFGGSLVSQVNKYVGAYERLMDEYFWSILTGIVSLLGSLIVLWIVAPKFALLLIAIVIIYVFLISKRVKTQMPYNIELSESESKRTAELADAITNISNIRAFANEEYELDRFKKTAYVTSKKRTKLAFEVFKSEIASHTMTNTFRILAFSYGVIAVTAFHSSASILYLVISYSSGIVDRLWQFGRTLRNINQGLSDSNEMLNTLEVAEEIKNPENPEKSKISRGDINFSDVLFTHNENKNALFKDFNVHIKQGEKIGLVGPSGSGKTTFTNLLLRVIDVDGGHIDIDGQDIRKITQKDLRRAITYVPQEPVLFHRSIADNIGYGDLDADNDAIVGAAKLANAHEFIEKLPMGYKTLVGERGVKLSGGQRQRIAIARAMLKNSPILILDEATSALDSENEAKVQDALNKLIRSRTTIIVAHRLSTIKDVDRILVIKNGIISEEGSHKELIRKDGLYAKLWNRQSGGFIRNNELEA